ncbi:MAG: GreA/GreB family elongation factor [Bacteroidota bacterium]
MTCIELKEALLLMCVKHVKDRKQKVLASMSRIEDSMFEESKSSAGDKHNTGRAMLQIERENVGYQLMEVEKVEAILRRISVYQNSDTVHMGSLVTTKNAKYFLSISAGMVFVNGTHYICVSLGSPIGQLLLGKKEGDAFTFSGKHHTILDVC